MNHNHSQDWTSLKLKKIPKSKIQDFMQGKPIQYIYYFLLYFFLKQLTKSSFYDLTKSAILKLKLEPEMSDYDHKHMGEHVTKFS